MVDINKSYDEMMGETQSSIIINQNQIATTPTMSAKSALERLQDEDFIETLRCSHLYCPNQV